MSMLTKIFVVALIFSVFAIGSITLFSDLEATYEPNLSTDFKAAYKSFNTSTILATEQAQSKAMGLSSNLSSTSTTTVDTPENSLKAGAWGAITLLWNLPNLITGIFQGITNYLGIPPFIFYMVIALISVTIAIIVIGLIFFRKP